MAPEPEPKDNVLTVRQAVKDFLANVESRIGNDGYGAPKKTLKAYQRRLSFLLEFDGVTPVTEINQKYFERYRTFLRSRITNDRYCFNILQTTNTLFRTLDITCCDKVLRETGYRLQPSLPASV
jgi:hypothetical protein